MLLLLMMIIYIIILYFDATFEVFLLSPYLLCGYHQLTHHVKKNTAAATPLGRDWQVGRGRFESQNDGITSTSSTLKALNKWFIF